MSLSAHLNPFATALTIELGSVVDGARDFFKCVGLIATVESLRISKFQAPALPIHSFVANGLVVWPHFEHAGFGKKPGMVPVTTHLFSKQA